MFRASILFLAFLFSLSLEAQEYRVNVGFGMGDIGPGLNAFKEEINYHNKILYPNSLRPIDTPLAVRGISVDFMVGSLQPNSLYFFWNWNNKHVVTDGVLTNPDTGKTFRIAFKYRHNTMNLGAIGYRFKGNFSLAFSPFDVGYLKVFSKRSPKKYAEIYDVDNHILSDHFTFGCSAYLEYVLFKQVNIRAGYYYTYSDKVFYDKENPTRKLIYTPSQFSVTVQYMLALTE